MNITIQRLGVDAHKWSYPVRTIALARILQIAATGKNVGQPLSIYLAQAHGIHTNPALTERLKEYIA